MAVEIVTSALPDPLTPPDCDLRGMPFMPLEVARVMQSTMFAKSSGDEFKAAFALWCASWMEVPAASLPDDDEMLEYLSRSKHWKKVKAKALRGWLLCSDGRLYHSVVAKNALEAWDRRLDYQESSNNKTERQKRWRERCKQLSDQLREFGITAPRGASLETLEQMLRDATVPSEASTQPSTQASTETSTVDDVEIGKTGTETGTVKGQGQLLKPSVANATGADAPPVDPVAAMKKEIWGAGKALFASKGIDETKAGKILGLLLGDYSAEIVLEAVRAGVKAEPPDPTAYLKACCQTTAGERAKVQKNSRHNGFDQTDYSEGVTEDGRIA